MALDLISLTSLTISNFGFGFPVPLMLGCAAYLIAKGFLFRDFMSFVDMGCGFYMVLVAIFHFNSFVYYIILGWFVYKLASTVSF